MLGVHGVAGEAAAFLVVEEKCIANALVKETNCSCIEDIALDWG
jgi:hypothetical protein